MNVTIDFGGTNIKVGLVQDGKLLAKSSIPAWSDSGLLARLSDSARSVRELLAEVGAELSQCVGIGIALPGIVDSRRKTLTSINEKYTDAIGFDFSRWAKEEFGLPIAVENDARAALIGEAAYGAAQGEKDAVLIIFGTGIGTAALMDGQVLRGRHHQAGILGGHLSTDLEGEPCACGNVGCVEAQASHWAIPIRASKLPGFANSSLANDREWGYEAVIKASADGDVFASELLEDLIRHWSAGIVNLVHAYDPEVVLLSGGLMKSSELLLPRLQERVGALAWTPWGKPRFAVAEDPEISALLGMSFMAEQAAAVSGAEG
ncbi:ROK family protein [Cohnella yongneupensis]|uniref:ROK family protein n=1 Tax=Cohnella yongneupensis TaxID=425006 RepID=A0ABW0R0J2_9BACL